LPVESGFDLDVGNFREGTLQHIEPSRYGAVKVEQHLVEVR
jgi:hypothetical protein